MLSLSLLVFKAAYQRVLSLLSNLSDLWESALAFWCDKMFYISMSDLSGSFFSMVWSVFSRGTMVLIFSELSSHWWKPFKLTIMLLDLGGQLDNNPLIKQRHLKNDKDKEQFSLNESTFVIIHPLKNITNNRQRRYTCELQDNELLNQWFYISWHLSSLSR